MRRSSLSFLRPTQIMFAASALAVLTRLTLFVANTPFIEGDTDLLVRIHTNAIRACLNEGRWLACPESGDFPLLQNIPSLILSYLGFSSSSILHSLAYLNFLSFLGSLLLIFWTL